MEEAFIPEIEVITLDRGDPTGPMENGMTYIVLPFMQPGNRSPQSSASKSDGDIHFPKLPATPLLSKGEK